MKRVIVATTRRNIKAASDTEDTRVSDMVDSLKDDFEFAIDSFGKLERNGNVAEALSIMTELSKALNAAIQACADQISQ